jgi:short-subunit dehydrogenase
MELAGRVALVTGASRGLGRHVAKKLAREGMRVVVAARNRDELDALVAEIVDAGGEALAVTVDLTRREEIDRAVSEAHDRFGPIDVLVNNAGVGWYKPFLEQSPEEIDLTIGVNVRGVIHMTHAVLPDMMTRGEGQIINIASDLARRYLPNMAVYVGSKHAVIGFGGSLLREVKARNVKVTTITPGIIDTFFGGGSEGTRDPSWALEPHRVADFIWAVLNLPDSWVADEIAIHPLHQEF